MKGIRKERGITLVALIITIVVLLILAVVAVGIVRDSGIIGHAQNAAGDYNAAKGKEEGIIAGYEALIDKYAPGVTMTDDNVPVPAGFKVVEGTKDTGLVIEHETEGSQFVWVPVTTPLDPKGYDVGTSDFREPDKLIYTGSYSNASTPDSVPSNLLRAGCEEDPEDSDDELTEDDFKVHLTKEYQEMVESVNKNKGFYIGRYEVSINGNRAQSKGSTESVPVYSALDSTRSLNSNNATDWYGLYALCKSYNTGSVKSTMMWGSQYDALSNWLGNEAINFNLENRNKDENSRTGLVSTDVVKNIYDLCGCTAEYTLEAFGMDRVLRGGDYRTEWKPCSISTNITNASGDNWPWNRGSRLALFIKDSSDSTDIDNGIFAENPVYNIGKYARYDVNGDGKIDLNNQYESILWRVLTTDKDKVELITADALGTLDLTPKDFNDARVKYNTALDLIVQKCREVTGIDTVRSIGGPAEDGITETIVFRDYLGFAPEEGVDFSQYEVTEQNPENGFLEMSDNFDDIDYIGQENLREADNSRSYWFALRYIYTMDYGSAIIFNIGFEQMCNMFTILNNGSILFSPEYKEDDYYVRGVRPVLTLDAGILNTISSNPGTKDNPIEIYQNN